MRTLAALAALTCLLYGPAAAQDAVSFKLTPPAGKTHLAEVFKLKVEAAFPQKYSIRPDTSSLDNSDFSLISFTKTGESEAGGLRTAVFELKAQAFALGVSTFPAVSWALYEKSGGPAAAEAKTQPFVLQVLPLFEDKEGDKNIRDIYPPYRYVPWLLLAAALAAAAAAWQAWNAYRRNGAGPLAAAPAWKDARTAYQRARARLDAVEKAGLPAAGRLKEHYIGLTAILRFYLADEFGINAELMTTSDLARELKNTSADLKTKLAAKDFLQKADLVKFAKLKPEDAEADARALDAMLMEFTRAAENARAAAASAAAEKAAAEKAAKAGKKP
jgi:hypothetical protein